MFSVIYKWRWTEGANLINVAMLLPHASIQKKIKMTMKTKLLKLLALITVAASSAIAAPEKKALPKVLIIGDSISIGYTPFVQKLLKDTADVGRIKGNAQHTDTGLKLIDKWVGDTKWDVIHFNWGLWDLCHRNPDSKVQGKRDKVNGTVTISLEKYEKNLEKLVVRLKKTGATLIWAETTLVPEKEAGRNVGDDKKYNDIAAKVMKKHGVRINELNVLTSKFPADHFKKMGDVHYKKEGSSKLGEQVANEIRAALEKNSK